MKRTVQLLLICMTLLLSFAHAENLTADYSWLDDLTINQLRALDAEIHKRLPAETPGEDTGETSSAEGILNLLLGGNTPSAPAAEPVPIGVNEKIVTDTAEFEVLGTSFMGTKSGTPSGWRTISSEGAKEKFYFDADCGAFVMAYRVKNISNKAKWYWPSSLKLKIHWNDYEFECMTPKPMGDLQITQQKVYLAVVQIPNKILAAGCKDIVIEFGFKEHFATFSSLDDADHRFVMHQGY